MRKLKYVKLFENFENSEHFKNAIQTDNLEKNWSGSNSDWSKNNLPFDFKSPISGQQYKIVDGSVTGWGARGYRDSEDIYNLNLYGYVNYISKVRGEDGAWEEVSEKREIFLIVRNIFDYTGSPFDPILIEETESPDTPDSRRKNRNSKRNIYIRVLPEKDKIFKIINDVKLEIEKSVSGE